MNLNELETFVMVAKHGSFSAAARALGIPKSTVSRRVARLEDELGIALLTRATRSVGLTDDGRRLYERSRAALHELDEVASELVERSASPTGTLRLTAAPDAADTGFFMDLVAAYRRRCPGVTVEVELTNRMVDLVEEGFDVAFRPNASLQRRGGSLMGRRLAAGTIRLWGSEDYLARRGTPTDPSELAQHDGVIHPVFARQELALRHVDGGEPRRVRPQVVLSINNFRLVRHAIAEGLGIGPLPPYGGESGGRALVPVLPDWRLQPADLWLVWPAARHLSPRVRAFVDEVTRYPWEDDRAYAPRSP